MGISPDFSTLHIAVMVIIRQEGIIARRFAAAGRAITSYSKLPLPPHERKVHEFDGRHFSAPISMPVGTTRQIIISTILPL